MPYMVSLIVLLIECLFIIGFLICWKLVSNNTTACTVCAVILCLLHFGIPALLMIAVVVLGVYGDKFGIKNRSFLKYVWFIPGLYLLITTISACFHMDDLFRITGIVVVVTNLLVAGTFLFIGRWATKAISESAKQTNTAIAYFDDLLKRGVITKEEYDAKVKKIKGE